MNSNKKIAVYDNTITAREYIGYIAECAGDFACIGRDGKLYFRSIGQDETEIPLKLFAEYKWGEEFKISKVSYEDGTRSYKFGDDTRNNLWINQDNMYIVDEEQVENIYNKINGFTINSFEGKTIIDPAIDIGDKIIIDGKPVIYQGEMTLESRFITEISSKVQIKQKQETTVKKESQAVINRRVKSEINQIDGKITSIIEEQDEQSSKISKVEQGIDGITEQISNIQQFTKKLTGTNQLSISNAEKFQILEFIANGQTREFEYIYPREDLYPSEDLYSQGVYSKLTLVIDTQKRTSISKNAKKIEIDMGEPLYSLDDICDKLKIEVNEDKATCTVKVIRNLKYENGAISKLENEVETILSKDLDVGLFEGENYIYLLEYPEWQIEATYMYKSDLNKYLATKVEMNAKITKKADEINIEVSRKVDESEFGTLIEQNIEAIKIAWNQISQYLKLEGLNGQVSFNIYDNNDNLLMSLDSNGQRFYKDSSLVGHIGTNQLAEDNSKKSLDFDLDVDGNSMIWASKKSSSDKYYYWKWAYTKGGISTAQDEGIYAGANIFLLGYELQINDYLKFNGGNGLVIGDNNQFYFNLDNGSIWFDTDGSINCTNIYADNISSDGRLKENIKESIISALEIIKEIEVRSFDWKKDKRHIEAGFIAQEMEKIDENFVLKSPIKDSDGNIVDNKYYINELPIIATLTKGIQEQQKEIEELKYIVEKQEIYIQKILQKLNIEEVIEDVTVFKEKQRNTKFKTIQYEKPIKENPKFKEGKPIQIKMLKENGFIKLIKEEVKKEEK